MPAPPAAAATTPSDAADAADGAGGADDPDELVLPPVDATMLSQLMEFGFSETHVRRCLMEQSFRGGVDEAAGWLFDHAGDASLVRQLVHELIHNTLVLLLRTEAVLLILSARA